MIPIKDIQKVIETLDLYARACLRQNNHDKAHAYHSAIILLKELIPSEVSNTGDTPKHK